MIRHLQTAAGHLLVATRYYADYVLRSPRTVAVLGMHRSGTSCITRMINLCGADIGDHLVEGPANPTGHWEDKAGVELNRRILEESGGDWEDPPDEIKISRGLRTAMRSFVNGAHRGRDTIVWKDPRLSLTFSKWQGLLVNYSLVIPFRHPLEVAESLRTRNDFSLSKSEDLWLTYNQRIIDTCDRSTCSKVFINFSREEDHLYEKIQEVCEINNLTFTGESRKFYDPDVVTSGKAEGTLNNRTLELYDELERRAEV